MCGKINQGHAEKGSERQNLLGEGVLNFSIQVKKKS
jgi:hypothetical protein